MAGFLRDLKAVTHSPLLNCTVGLIMFATGLIEAGEDLWDDLYNFEIGAHHGVMAFGLLHAIKSLPDLFEGVEYFDCGAERD